jgi:hypothetical protein
MKRQMVCLGMAVFFALSLLWAGNAPAQAPKPIELTFNHFLPSVAPTGASRSNGSGPTASFP